MIANYQGFGLNGFHLLLPPGASVMVVMAAVGLIWISVLGMVLRWRLYKPVL